METGQGKPARVDTRDPVLGISDASSPANIAATLSEETSHVNGSGLYALQDGDASTSALSNVGVWDYGRTTPLDPSSFVHQIEQIDAPESSPLAHQAGGGQHCSLETSRRTLQNDHSRHQSPLAIANVKSGSEIAPLNCGEADLLSFYRYRIAPSLDLGVGDAYWGVAVLQHSVRSQSLRDAVCRLAGHVWRCQQTASAVDMSQYTVSSLDLDAFKDSGVNEEMATSVLGIYLSILQSAPQEWLHMIKVETRRKRPSASDQCELLWERIRFAALLMAPSATLSKEEIPIAVARPDHTLEEGAMSPEGHLRHAMHLLCRAVLLCTPAVKTSRSQIPFGSLWQSCWSDTQIWYVMRSEEMQQVFELTDWDVVPSDCGSLDLPCIIFTNACAALSNVVHHLTSLLLLQHKPRLMKATAERGSSTSTIWHAVRVVGIATVAVEDGLHDPLLVAASFRAGQVLSHSGQLAAVANTLRQTAAFFAMQLDHEILEFENACRATAMAG